MRLCERRCAGATVLVPPPLLRWKSRSFDANHNSLLRTLQDLPHPRARRARLTEEPETDGERVISVEHRTMPPTRGLAAPMAFGRTILAAAIGNFMEWTIRAG